MNKTLKIGDRVRLSPDTKWDKTLKNYYGVITNPMDVNGTIVSINAIGQVSVRWDNEADNIYKPHDNDLILQQIGDPDLHTLNTVRW